MDWSREMPTKPGVYERRTDEDTWTSDEQRQQQPVLCVVLTDSSHRLVCGDFTGQFKSGPAFPMPWFRGMQWRGPFDPAGAVR